MSLIIFFLYEGVIYKTLLLSFFKNHQLTFPTCHYKPLRHKQVPQSCKQEKNKQRFNFIQKFFKPSTLTTLRFFYDPFSSAYKFAWPLLIILLLILIMKNKKAEMKTRTTYFKKEPHFLLDQSRTCLTFDMLHIVYIF